MRLLFLIPVLVGVLTLAFVLSHVIPADPVALAAGQRASPEDRAALARKFGLDKPLYIQYYNYLSGFFLRLDLGKSLATKNYVMQDLVNYFPASLELVTTAMIITVLVSIPLGVLSAAYKDKAVDHGARTFAICGTAIPDYWLAMILQILIAWNLGILPVGGRIDPNVIPPRVTGMLMVDSLLEGNLAAFQSAFLHIILPAVVLSVGSIGILTRSVRSSMLDVLGKDYVRTSRAYGYRERTVVYRHALKNGLIPPVTYIGIQYAGMFGYAVVVEKIFAYPGIGLYIANSVLNVDYPAIIGGMIFLSLIVLITNLFVDILYVVIDPRVTY